MTQKSVSIRANVSIRGVTIRAYALYQIVKFAISSRYLKKKFSINGTAYSIFYLFSNTLVSYINKYTN